MRLPAIIVVRTLWATRIPPFVDVVVFITAWVMIGASIETSHPALHLVTGPCGDACPPTRRSDTDLAVALRPVARIGFEPVADCRRLISPSPSTSPHGPTAPKRDLVRYLSFGHQIIASICTSPRNLPLLTSADSGMYIRTTCTACHSGERSGPGQRSAGLGDTANPGPSFGFAMVEIRGHPPALPPAGGLRLCVPDSKVGYLDAEPQLHSGAVHVRPEGWIVSDDRSLHTSGSGCGRQISARVHARCICVIYIGDGAATSFRPARRHRQCAPSQRRAADAASSQQQRRSQFLGARRTRYARR